VSGEKKELQNDPPPTAGRRGERKRETLSSEKKWFLEKKAQRGKGNLKCSNRSQKKTGKEKNRPKEFA